MSRLVDLTLPIVHGGGRLGLPNEFEVAYSFERVNWQGSVFRMFAHSGTHVDAPIHFIRDGATIEQTRLGRLIGPGVVFDLSAKQGSEAIGPADLAAQDPGLRAGEMAILRTDWSDKHWGTARFFEDSPYLTTDGARWLVKRQVSAIVYDFSEEYAVRTGTFRGEHCPVHHVILGAGIPNIEYVTNLGALQSTRVTIVAAPLKLVGLDGAPVRVIAFDPALDEALI